MKTSASSKTNTKNKKSNNPKKVASADVATSTAAKENEMQRSNNETNGDSERNDVSKFDRDVEATAKAVAEATEEVEKAKKTGKTVTLSVDEYEKLKQELDEAKDRGLRALAELENFRARSNRIAQEERKYASLDLARAILPVWDNMGRALEAAEQNYNGEALVDGVKMMYKEFLDILAKNNIERIDALHKPFDPNFEESIAFMPSEEYPANTVVAETQAGFKLRDRVVRPAQVVLAAPKPKTSAQKKDDENADSLQKNE